MPNSAISNVATTIGGFHKSVMIGLIGSVLIAGNGSNDSVGLMQVKGIQMGGKFGKLRTHVNANIIKGQGELKNLKNMLQHEEEKVFSDLMKHPIRSTKSGRNIKPSLESLRAVQQKIKELENNNKRSETIITHPGWIWNTTEKIAGSWQFDEDRRLAQIEERLKELRDTARDFMKELNKEQNSNMKTARIFLEDEPQEAEPQEAEEGGEAEEEQGIDWENVAEAFEGLMGVLEIFAN